MTNKLITEYQWRKQVMRTKKRPGWYGPQCYYRYPTLHRLLHRRTFQYQLLFVSLIISFLLPAFCTPQVENVFLEIKDSTVETYEYPRLVSDVSYDLPKLDYKQHVFTREELARGKMLLIDPVHSLPEEALAPNCFSIAKYANGMVPVRSLSVKTGLETMGALVKLFENLREMGATGIYVYRGTTTAEEQMVELVQNARSLMKNHPASTAIHRVLNTMDWPGTGEYLQEYSVEIRVKKADGEENKPLEATAQGQVLLRAAWRYGFVRPNDARPFCFRYVGIPHATAMTYLNLDYADYLEWLHQKGCMVIRGEGKVKYLILCQPMEGSHIAFDLPVGCEFEASLDNLGYALVACAL